MRSTCGMFRHRLHIKLSGHLTLVMQTLHLMPCPLRDEIAGCVEKLRNHKAGTEEGIVQQDAKVRGASHPGHACWARGDPVDHGE